MGAEGTFLALLPAIVAIVLALVTKEVYSSLFIGIVIGAFLLIGISPAELIDKFANDGFINTVSGLGGSFVDKVVNDGLISAVTGNVGIFIFLIILGIMVSLINSAGGSVAFGKWAEKNIKTKVGAQLATFALGVMIFIDDYFNCLTVGSVMRPITDSKKISRAKLAYLIDATAAPICMIAPVSSWAAAVSSVAEEAGIGGIQLFCRAIFFNYYSLLTFVFVIGLIILKFDFGPMKKHEMAAEKGDVGGLAEKGDDKPNSKGKIIDLIIPVVVLIITCVIGLIYVGGFFGDDPEFRFNLVMSFGNTDAVVGLPWGALIALVVTIIYLMIRKVVNFKTAMGCLTKGFSAMVPAILILTLAVSLKNMTSSLGAAEFVSNFIEKYAAGFYNFLPAVIFVVACLLAFATGTSWGTFTILIPIVTSIFAPETKLFTIGISACLAGAVCGDHCSPISDTTIMASAGANVEHVNHVSTQLPYALSVAVVSFLTYVVVGRFQNAVIGLIMGTVLTIGMLFILKAFFGSQKKPSLDDNI